MKLRLKCYPFIVKIIYAIKSFFSALWLIGFGLQTAIVISLPARELGIFTKEYASRTHEPYLDKLNIGRRRSSVGNTDFQRLTKNGIDLGWCISGDLWCFCKLEYEIAAILHTVASKVASKRVLTTRSLNFDETGRVAWLSISSSVVGNNAKFEFFACWETFDCVGVTRNIANVSSMQR